VVQVLINFLSSGTGTGEKRIFLSIFSGIGYYNQGKMMEVDPWQDHVL
jgi:hypothetical protein